MSKRPEQAVLRNSSPSIAALLARDASRLAEALSLPVADARSEAQILLAQALGKSRAWLMAHAQDGNSEALLFSTPYATWLERRISGEPIAYLLGRREFYGLDFEVNKHVLIPRPETELLVAAALHHLPKARPNKVLDLGTGSGCIAVAVAAHAPQTNILGVDASSEALGMAARNLQNLGVENLDLLHSDWYTSLQGMCFDIIVSNPPYVADYDTHLTQGDLRFEPRNALTPGANALQAIERIIEDAPSFLRTGGWLMLEHGYDQAEAVRARLQQRGFQEITSLADLAGLARVSIGHLV